MYSNMAGMAYAAGMCTGGGTCALIGTHSRILTEVIITTAHEVSIFALKNLNI